MKLHPLLALSAAAALSVSLAAPAWAATSSFSASLSGLNEAPANASPASGSALVTLDDVAHTVLIHVTFANLSAPASAAHIHCCTATPGSGTVGVMLGFTGFPNALSGTFDATLSPALTGANSFANLQAGILAGKAYVNIHDSIYPAGEVRGFLAAAPVPEPASIALMLGGLGVVGWAARRRAQG